LVTVRSPEAAVVGNTVRTSAAAPA